MTTLKSFVKFWQVLFILSKTDFNVLLHRNDISQIVKLVDARPKSKNIQMITKLSCWHVQITVIKHTLFDLNTCTFISVAHWFDIYFFRSFRTFADVNESNDVWSSIEMFGLMCVYNWRQISATISVTRITYLLLTLAHIRHRVPTAAMKEKAHNETNYKFTCHPKITWKQKNKWEHNK